MLMFFLNVHHTDDACLRYLVDYIRENPAAFLFSDWWNSEGEGGLMALTLAPDHPCLAVYTESILM